MTLSSHGLAILVLLATSLLVRVLPVFARLHMSAALQKLLERAIPLAVFLNFAVYIAWTEMRTAPVPALVAIAVVAILTLSTRIGLVLTTATATMIYALVQMSV